MQFMKKIVFFGVCLALLEAVAWAKDDRTLWVSGEGEAAAKADQVSFVVGIDITEPKFETAKAKSDEVMRKLLSIARDFKIEPRDIQSNYLQIQPIIDNPYGPNAKPSRTVTAYNARRDVRILWKDLKRYEELIAVLMQSGINQMHSLQFSSSQHKQLEESARSEALKQAKAKAEAMAREMGQKLGRVHSIADGVHDMGPGPQPMLSMQKSMARSPSGEDPTLAPGEIRVSREVSVLFELE